MEYIEDELNGDCISVNKYKSYSWRYLTLLMVEMFEEKEDVEFSFEIGRLLISELIEEGYENKMMKDLLYIIKKFLRKWKEENLGQSNKKQYLKNLIGFERKFQRFKDSVLHLFSQLDTFLQHYSDKNLGKLIEQIYHRELYKEEREKIEGFLVNIKDIEEFWEIIENYDPLSLKCFFLQFNLLQHLFDFSQFDPIFKLYVASFSKSKGLVEDRNEALEWVEEYKQMKGVYSKNKRKFKS